MTKEPSSDEEAMLETEEDRKWSQVFEIPCPKCGEQRTYIDNPSNPTVYSCAKCKHRWNPDNEKQKEKGPGWSVRAVGYPGMGRGSSPRWAIGKDYSTDYLNKQGEWGRSMFAATFMSREDAQKFADEKLGGQVVKEDGAAAGGQGGPGAPGTGMGNVTANVDPIRTPKAFKHPKDLPAQTEGNSEDDEALYVEYVGQMRDEEPFMMGGQKFQYVQAKYPSGKQDIGVYAFSGDLVYGYQAWRQMHNIKEEADPTIVINDPEKVKVKIKEDEMTDALTGNVAPGPRDRFDMQPGGSMGRKPVPQKVNKPAVKKALAAIGVMKNHEWRPLLDRSRKAYQLFPDDGNDPQKLNLVMALQYMDEHPDQFGKEPLRESVTPKRVIKLKNLLK